MRKELKKILSFMLIVSIVLGMTIFPKAEDISITIQNNPKIDIALTIKDTNLDFSNFENDILTALEEQGINTSNITFQAIESGEVSTSTMDASTIFNEWGRIGKTGSWSLVDIDGEKAIQNKENTFGMTGFYYKDNFNLRDMTLEFDARPIDGDDDYFGIFLRFNVNSETVANTSKKATTYMYIEQKNNVNDFKTKNGLFRLINKTLLSEDKTYTDQSSTLGGCIQQVTSGWTATKTTFNHYKFTIQGNHIIGYRDNVKIIDYTDTSTNAIKTGSFGFVNWSQPAQFKNFVATFAEFKEYKELLYNTTWREDAMHILVNVDNKIDTTLTGTDTIGEILSRTLADDTHFIQWGTDENKESSLTFIKQNDNKGLFTYNNDYEQALQNTIDYIKDMAEVESTNDQTITIGQDINLIVTPEQFKTNATSTKYPNGRWKINHDYKYYQNNSGQSEFSGIYTKNLNCKFDKPGKYEILFDDKIIKTIYVHRKPVADFEINIDNTNLTLISTSYDLDSDIKTEYGTGIISEKWYYKEASASEWTEGKLTNLDKTKIYVIKLEVKDNEGITNYTTKYVGTGNPVANFNFANSTICKFNKLEINNTSYDPIGYNIKSESWELKKDGKTIGTYTTPILDFNTSNLGPGEYSYTLIVTNEQNTKSEAYTKSFTITDDIIKPEIIIDTEISNDWITDKDVQIELSDNDSSISKWRYEFVTSSTPTNNETDWSEWDTKETDININSGALSGRYYLHIQVYDEANNLAERTIGPFNLDNTNPVIENIEVNKQDFRKTKVIINAFDEHSGIVGYAITKAEPMVYSRLRTVQIIPEFQESNEFIVAEDGLYTAWAIDGLGNIETAIYEVTDSNKINKMTMVYAEIGSEFKVTIPKKVTLDGETKLGNYQVSVEGDIAGLETIMVEPDIMVQLNSKSKQSVNGLITQNKIQWTYNEILETNKVLGNGLISAQDITAGEWNGSFNFNIKLENNGKYINSEWYVEYETYLFE